MEQQECLSHLLKNLNDVEQSKTGRARQFSRELKHTLHRGLGTMERPHTAEKIPEQTYRKRGERMREQLALAPKVSRCRATAVACCSSSSILRLSRPTTVRSEAYAPVFEERNGSEDLRNDEKPYRDSEAGGKKRGQGPRQYHHRPSLSCLPLISCSTKTQEGDQRSQDKRIVGHGNDRKTKERR